MRKFYKSEALNDVCYDIRGPVLNEAMRLEEEGFQLIKLNIGNTAPFGLETPDEMIHDLILNIRNAQGYCDSKGIFPARKAVVQDFQKRGIETTTDNVFIGNGVSELIKMTMEGLLNDGDEILLPAPDYPLWTASVTLARGNPVHYICDEKSDWQPDLEDIRRKITPRSKALVLINPNNPTGAVYSREILEGLVKIAEEHELLLLADEIYDRVLYDDAEHISIASLCEDLPVITFGGLAKAYRAPGFRSGWMVLSGNLEGMSDYIEGLNMLASMRLCANVPSQYTIQTALGGRQSIQELTAKEGRLYRQRELAWKMLNDIPGVSCVKPKGALYLFPKLDKKKFHIDNDVQLILDLLRQEKVLVVQGSGFNWPDVDHIRMVFLPYEEMLSLAINRIREFLDRRAAGQFVK